MDVNEPVEVHTTTNLSEAEILKNVLEAEGIKCEVDSENQGSFAGIVGVRVLVRASDEERARKVLASHGHHHGEHPGKPEGN